MRRSKSNPAKYARNYRSISQRRMTEYDNVDEEKEMERLRAILKDSQPGEQLEATQAPTDDADDTADGSNSVRKGSKRSRSSTASGTNDTEDTKSLSATIISDDILREQEGAYPYGEDETSLVVLPPRKKKLKSKRTMAVDLTPQEIRQAKLLQKNSARKLKQLTERAKQKKRRTELYAKLQENAISTQERQLLLSSSTLGKRETKKETLKRLVQRERAGILLTEEEKNVLYQERQVDDGNYKVDNERPVKPVLDTDDNAGRDQMKTGDLSHPTEGDEQQSRKKERKNRRQLTQAKGVESETEAAKQEEMPSNVVASSTAVVGELAPRKPKATVVPQGLQQEETQQSDSTPISFAAQMMASLSSLKVQSTKQKKEQDTLKAKEVERLEAARLQEEEKKRREQKRYIPANPVVLKSPANLGLDQPRNVLKQSRTVLEVNRPADIEASRYELPVSAMEFEIVDAIRNNDVVIICGETGSGKSTQVPQFLYEAGFSVNERDDNQNLLIGVTQPRRVAAVSTAKRVCYEMGHGDGRKIQNDGASKDSNLVAYQTRYETAGLGRDTRVKFMTDGILLQEIQSDLLLRKYGAIILDEAHERNLNTDVLLGLLSVAVPLRRKAASEKGSRVPALKLIIMSATLRVEDFTENSRLFPESTPALVKVPGRTHPVTLHHSKTTVLDDYETATFNKVCKIHRKLPKGGILVFLTGKQEILRMVHRLRRALGYSTNSMDHRTIHGGQDVRAPWNNNFSGCAAPRDLDDEEIDGDMFWDYDFDDSDADCDNGGAEEMGASTSRQDQDDNIPKRVLVLPLYSMLSAEEQARVFEKVPEGCRLIVIATNIAETSITIPDISYVVDCGRQKCRNYHAGTGVASYDVMWISRAAADQRAGRAGRTGPGHCYRMYSSSMYSRQMSSFALPEVLTRPLEDVVLAMKAMNVSNVASFPFPTAPDQSQLDASIKMLSNIGCLDLTNVEKRGGDGDITRLGAAVAQLPLGVRHGKMLLVAAQAGVLDYAIIMVAVQSESCPFQRGGSNVNNASEQEDSHAAESLDEIDLNAATKQEEQAKKELAKSKWSHRGGDILAAVHAVGAYTYAGRGAGGVAEKVATRTFCEENGLNPVIMERIQKMRFHLARLAKHRLNKVEGVASKTGGILNTLPPPNKLQENLLLQAIASGLLDNVATLAPPGSIASDHPHSLRSAYLSCSKSMKEPLFMDRNSVLFSQDSRRLPQWVCFDSIVRKATKDGSTITNMKNVSPIGPSWLGSLAKGTGMLTLGEPLPSPLPSYDADQDAILCSVSTKFGSRGWEIPPMQVEMFGALQSAGATKSGHFLVDDSFRWFARYLLEGKVLPELCSLASFLNDEPSIITRKKPLKKVALLVSALSGTGIDSASALRKHWAEVDDKFLFQHLKSWTMGDHKAEVKRLWIATVKSNVNQWNEMAHR